MALYFALLNSTIVRLFGFFPVLKQIESFTIFHTITLQQKILILQLVQQWQQCYYC